MNSLHEDVARILLERARSYEGSVERDEIGAVLSAGDGIARIYGLDGVEYGELVSFDSGALGLALDLDSDDVGVVLLYGENAVREGETARRLGKAAEIPVGQASLGRTVDPLGTPLDAMGAVIADRTMPIEKKAPSVVERKSVGAPLRTGTLAIDAMVPIGRGQRELIIGDRQTGKTAIAVDAVLAQKGTGVVCVYAAIGQKASTTAQVIETLRRAGALEYTVIVAATAKTSAALQYLAPYSACAVAEFFMERGDDVLVVYDDLSKHAVAYRALSLLLRRPPGREAYPGDVFYLHSRLLERAASLSDALGGGSMTALPIVETQGGDISAYIPTNVISITDGQVFLQSDLFYAGVRPAVDVGLSVSRVGGSAQCKAVRKLAGRLRIDLAQYRELAVFAQFGSDLDKATQDRLEHGERLVELLKQGQYEPMALSEEIVLLYAAAGGYLAGTKPEGVAAFREQSLRFFKYRKPEILARIDASGDMDAESEAGLKAGFEELAGLKKAE
ncbi:MAG: F0F1 ATP synthase subunit alpha [Spirochaetes bacterium]|nr:F0F1 ATP synthase subunit alpha [Spirochaetota bacterium]MBU1078955.1 F0F1 ATP synthase subunit alpha [Spirochaetota bacterium]